MIKNILYGQTEGDGSIPVKYSTIQLNMDVFKQLPLNCSPNIRYNWQKQQLECYILNTNGKVQYFTISEKESNGIETPYQLVEKILECVK